MSEVIVLTPQQVQALVQQAARQGASEVLDSVVRDLATLREILEAQRGVLSKHQCMRLLQITSDTTYYKRCDEGLPYYVIGNQRFHFLEDVKDWMRSQNPSTQESEAE